MKIINGFVSNSSSSSFLIVGVQNPDQNKAIKLAKADEFEQGGYGVSSGKLFDYLGGYYNYDEDEAVVSDDFNPDYIGIGCEGALKSGKTVTELKKEFIEKTARYGVIFDDKEIDLYYGEVSSE
jgi:hypothetical protein